MFLIYFTWILESSSGSVDVVAAGEISTYTESLYLLLS